MMMGIIIRGVGIFVMGRTATMEMAGAVSLEAAVIAELQGETIEMGVVMEVMPGEEEVVGQGQPYVLLLMAHKIQMHLGIAMAVLAITE